MPRPSSPCKAPRQRADGGRRSADWRMGCSPHTAVRLRDRSRGYPGVAASSPAPDSATKRDIINRFTNVLYDLTRRGIAEKIGHGPGARWKIASRDPELL